MKRLALITAACLGVLATIYLVFYIGIAPVMSAIASLGWSGFAILCAFGVGMFALLSVPWFVLIPNGDVRRWPTFFWGRSVRDSAAEILPLSQIGGFVIGARAVALRGVSAADAYASTVVDVTTEMLAQILFVIMGAILFVRHLGLASLHSDLFVPLVIGPILAALGAAGFIIVQRKGPAFAESLTARILPQAVRHAGAFARSISAIYAHPGRIVASIAIHFVGWMVSALMSWVALRLIGVHVSYLSVVAIESALSAIRSAAVLVPSAMGVQEATYAMLMPLFGVSSAVGLALSLLKRAVNIAIGIPVLLSWQGMEGRQALAMETREERLPGR